VEKMSHSVATCFNIEDRGYIREGYWADLVAVDSEKTYEVSKNNLYYKCGWSPFEGVKFSHSIYKTWINGRLSYDAGKIIEGNTGARLTFHETK
jgi:dihydroorotase